MRNLILVLAGVCALFLVPAFAADKAEKKETKLTGKLVCTKCELKETKACGHCLIVKDGEKEVKYYLDDKGGKEAYHKECCQAPADATVTGGETTEKDGKKTITGGKVEIKKEEKKDK